MAEPAGGGAPWLSPRAASLRRRRRTRSGGERALSPANSVPVIPQAPPARPASKRARVTLKKPAGVGSQVTGARKTSLESDSSGDELDEDDLAEMQAMRDSLSNAMAKDPGMSAALDCEVIRPIGRGTFSLVFLARHKSTGEKLALKKLVPTSSAERILGELNCLARCRGQNCVIPTRFSYRCMNQVVLAMPYIKQTRFHDLCSTITYTELRRYMAHLLRALSYVHSLQIIHRDIKPPNFLYNRRTQQYALVDFGLAQKFTHDPGPNARHSNQRASLPANTDEMISHLYSAGYYAPQDLENPSKARRPANINPYLPQSGHLLPIPDHGSGVNAFQRLNGYQNFLRNNPQPSASSRIKRRGGDEVRRSPRKHPGSQTASSGYSTLTISGSTIFGRPATNSSLKRASSFTMLDPTSGVPSESQTPLMQASLTSRHSQSRGSRSSTARHYTPPISTADQSQCGCYGRPEMCSKCMSRRSQRVNRAGTPGFRPPEVLLKYPHQTPAVDMWAVGVMLLSLMSRTYPFFRAPDDMTNLAEIMSIFGSHKVSQAASHYGKIFLTDQLIHPVQLDELCVALARRRSDSPDPEPARANLVSKNSLQLLKGLMDVIAEDRLSAEEALQLPFFEDAENDHPDTSKPSS
ncbi:hypothetical protein TCAL_09463 [Tigriopus californicus]|uniref:non-specific serine/threonine protein kinase n=1 Tax=Tigriopus californicus TaxID=6832 RepID=A0A553PM53_TIGCA|nr:uncharacterized protein LOC131890095 [Tigriopus californicus]TRY78761.1 hypothetical protein TCAL_09463 [Tigriopus californicus]|eukprot:TCALIF_09463-PA protein Name:"Similar to CDC7 Cell division cycle 7-related protein kinase (Homo sapiens)" AED:0.01 eAED:0.01 QI:80/1/1/1/1/1/2/107/636